MAFDPALHPRWPGGAKGHHGGAFSPAWDHQAEDLYNKTDEEITEEQFLASLTPEQRRAIEQNERDLSKGVPTNAQISMGGYMLPTRQFSPARQRVEARLIGNMFHRAAVKAGTPPPGTRPTLIMLGGRTAAGKTTTLNKLGAEFDRSKFFEINADAIQEKLPGYTPRMAGLFNAEGQAMAAQAEKLARKAKLNVLYDATMKTTGSAMERLADYTADGYDVEGYFVHTSRKESARRSVERMMGGDRYVPPHVGLNSKTNEHTFDILKPNLTKWVLYDNNGSEPVEVARGGTKR